MDSIIKSVVITGASSGIGLSTCEKFLNHQYLVFGSVRRKSDGSALKKQLGENFIPLIFDVGNIKQIDEAVSIVKNEIGKNNLTALINNAGVAILGPLEFLEPTEFKRQIETNLIGVFNCVQAFLPLLGSQTKGIHQSPGRIINISSALGGKIGYPFYGAYCSSKHAVEGMSEALRRELAVHGINVSIVAPGAIRTPIWNKAENSECYRAFDDTIYEKPFKQITSDMKKLGANGLVPEIVAAKIFKATEAKRPKLRYTFISEFSLNLLYFAPRVLVDIILARYLGLRK